MTAKKTETKATTDTKPTEEHGIDASGKVNKNLDADGRDQVAQDGATARDATMQPATGAGGFKSQAEIAADAKKG